MMTYAFQVYISITIQEVQILTRFKKLLIQVVNITVHFRQNVKLIIYYSFEQIDTKNYLKMRNFHVYHDHERLHAKR